MSIGYASVNSIVLNYKGNANIKEVENIFISEIEYVNREDKLPSEDYNVLYAHNTLVKSKIVLEPNNIDSEVSLKVKFINNSNNDYLFDDVIYDKDINDETEELYSNSNIQYSFTNKNSLINKNGGAGGGISGVDGALSGYSKDNINIVPNATGGTQTTGGIGGYRGANGSFGQGGSGQSCDTVECGSSGGGGGSSFISGHNGCISILETSTQNNIIHTGSSKHYSGYIFTNTKMIDGFGYLWTTSQTTKTTMPSYREELTTSGNLGNGYARITYLRKE